MRLYLKKDNIFVLQKLYLYNLYFVKIIFGFFFKGQWHQSYFKNVALGKKYYST